VDGKPQLRTIIGKARAPYINKLAGECGLATNYHNISQSLEHLGAEPLRPGRDVEGLPRVDAVDM
jgi:hypothetical protein